MVFTLVWLVFFLLNDFLRDILLEVRCLHNPRPSDKLLNRIPIDIQANDDLIELVSNVNLNVFIMTHNLRQTNNPST